MAKRLIGSRCRLGSVEGLLYYTGGDRRRDRGSFGANLWRPVVTNRDFVAYLCESDKLFPNYFGEELFLTCQCLTYLTDRVGPIL